MEKIYRVCSRCVMDSSVGDIEFDEHGVCNYCRVHEEKVALIPAVRSDSDSRLRKVIQSIKAEKKGDYDCIVGLSGGVDSSYLAYLAVKMGLRPLAIHFDNGWNSELAVSNIEQIVTRLGLDLHTFVIDWEEFRDIQRSFFKANVVDIEMVTDHAIFAAIYQLARKHKIGYILSGTNAATESIMPPAWQHFKFDLRNLKAIHKRYGRVPIRNYPTLSIWGMAWNHYVRKIRSVSLLNFIDYKKNEAIDILGKEIGWNYYGGKHYESVFTRFYQSYILPVKFGIDKRRIHFSDLIMNGEMTRDDALGELEKLPYDPMSLEHDREFVCKKLNFGVEEFEKYMEIPPVSHFDYPSYARIAQRLVSIYKKRRYL